MYKKSHYKRGEVVRTKIGQNIVIFCTYRTNKPKPQ